MKQKTNRLHFSTRTIAMILSVIMLIGSIATGSMLSTFAAYLKDNVNSDAVSQAASEGSDIAKSAIPSQDADAANITDNNDAKDAPDLSGFEENEIVRGMKDDFAAVGANADIASTGWSGDFCLLTAKNSWTDWTDGYKAAVSGDKGTITIDLSNETIEDGKWYFKIKVNESYFYHGSDVGDNGATISKQSSKDSTTGASYINVSNFNLTGKSITISVKFNSDDADVSWAKVTEDWYLIGHQFNNKWSTSDKGYKMTENGSEYYYDKTVTANDDYFRVHNGSKEYGPLGNDQEVTFGTEYTLSDVSSENPKKALKIDNTFAGKIRIHWNADDKTVWVERRDFEIKLPASPEGYSVTATDGETVATTAGVRYNKDKTISVTVTPASTSNKVTAITAGTNTVSDVVDNHDGTYSATFPVTADATIGATVAAKTEYTVSYASNNNSYGTVAATKGDAAIASGATVLEGDAVTFSATPAEGYALVDWTGLSGYNPTTTVYVNSDLTVTGNFAVAGFRYVKVAATNEESDMTELPNGWYISGAISDGETFTIRNTATGNYLDAGATSGKYEWNSGWQGSGSKADASNWIATVPTTSSTTTVYWNNTGGVRYFVYDPDTAKVWVTDNDGARDEVILLAKDGTIRDWSGETFTSDFGDTTITVVTPAELDGSTYEQYAYKSNNSDNSTARAERYVFSSKDVNSGVTVKIKTTVAEEYAKKGYYVKGFVVSTREESYAVLKQEFVDEAVEDTYPEKERTAYKDPTVYDKIHGVYTETAGTRTYTTLPYNEFTFSIEGNPGTIEVTPVYFIAEEKSGDNVRFYAEGFAGDVKENWGGTLAVDVYGSGEGSRPYGEFPGQPMINYNGRYLMDIPRTNIQGITMNNYYWDKAHSNEYSNVTENYQTYDYNDFYYINEKEKVLGSDEDIIFSFRYKRDGNHNTQGTSNLADRVYYKDSTAIYGEGKTEYDNGTYHADDYRTGYATMTATHEAMYNFEWLTDFYGTKVDVFGDVINEGTEKGQYNPIRIVSNGYDLNKAGRFATAWAIYDPTYWTGDNPGTYNLVDVVGGQGKTDQSFQSESFFVDPGSEARVRFKYDASIRNNNNLAKDIYADYTTLFPGDDNKTVTQYWEAKFQLQNNGSTSYPALIADLVGVPAMITYEYEVKDGWSNKEVDKAISGYKENVAYRSDGRWYFSNSEQKVTSHIIVEYANKEAGPFVRDYFQPGQIDYTQEDYDKAEHDGLTTGVKAYFKNNEDEEVGQNVIKNTEGDTEASGITDGESTFKLYTEPDAEGDYTFIGWYLLNKDGSTTRFSTDSYYEAEVTNNDVFIARYIKTPAGSLKINHLLTNGSDPDAATCYVKVEVMTGDTVKYTYNETPNTINVTPTYIKSTSTDNLRITLRTDPKAFYKFINFYNEAAGTNALASSATNRDSFINSATIQSVNPTTNSIVFRTNQINTLFTEGVARTEPMNLYSKVDLPDYKYEIVYYYDSYRNLYGEQNFTVRDSFTYDELVKYMNLTGDELAFIDNEGDSGKTSFISGHAPFEDDFQKTISYEAYTLKQTRSYNKETLTLYLDVKANDITENNTVHVQFNLPYAVNSDTLLVPKPDSETQKVKMMATPNPDVTPKAVTCYNWFVTSGKQSVSDRVHVEEPVFVQAPLIIYDDLNNERYFKYWKVEKQGKYGAAPIEYTRCYDYQFNLSIFMDCIVTPVYTNVNETWSQTVNPPTSWDMYNRFDFIEAQKQDSQDLRISFLENSRNQYNEGGNGSRTKNTNAADVIYSDFLLNFNSEAKDENGDPILFKDGDANKKHVGLIIEAVDLMTADSKGGFDYTKDYSADSYYTSKGQSAEDLKSWISGSTASLSGCAKTEFDAKSLDNKNCIQYYYSLNNQTGNSTEGVALLDNLTNRYKVFRAYAYIGDYDTTTSKILNNENLKLSAPTYFTIYDVGSKGLDNTRNPRS